MSWEITCSNGSARYQYLGQEDEEEGIVDDDFNIDDVTHVNRTCDTSPYNYNCPADDIMIDTYEAETVHGTFTWTVTAIREGWDSYAEIVSVECDCPEECEILDEPDFSILEIEDEDEDEIY